MTVEVELAEFTNALVEAMDRTALLMLCFRCRHPHLREGKQRDCWCGCDAWLSVFAVERAEAEAEAEAIALVGVHDA